jgi:predicted SprT family Zn-dependent metalloprotease
VSRGPHKFVSLARVRSAVRKCRRRCSACTQIREQLRQRHAKESDQLVFVCESCEQLLDARGWLL